MDLKEMLGDAYKDGMTFDEINNFFADKKFADLSTGNYVDKNKYENEVKTLQEQLSAKDTELKNRLSDDERASLAQQEKDKEIEKLKQMLKDNTINGNKSTVNGITHSVRDMLGLDVNDKEFTAFVDNITSEDSSKSTSVATYVSKLVKDAYEKGKKDANKDNMGQLGKGKGNETSQEPNDKDKLGEFGKKLASMNGSSKQKFDYFKRN